MASDTFQSITIEGFKSIRSIEVSLRRINLLIGANGSGKSNFLEAFILLGAAHSGERAAYVEQQGGANKLLHFGSKTTQRIYVSLKSSHHLDIYADCRYTVDDSLGGTISSGWNKYDGPTFNRYRFRDTGEGSRLRTTNDLHNNITLSRLGGNLAAILYLLKQKYRESYELIRQTVHQAAPFFEDFRLEPMKLNPDKIRLEWRHVGTDDYGVTPKTETVGSATLCSKRSMEWRTTGIDIVRHSV